MVRVKDVMNSADSPTWHSWVPLTFRGVAALAQAPAPRHLLLQVVVALLGAGSILWFVATGWEPALQEALERLPEQVRIRHGQLFWPGASPVILARRPALALVVDLEGSNASGQLADLQCEFGRTSVKLRSVLGYLNVDYPREWQITLNRLDAEAWWGAWRPLVWSASGLALLLGLMLGWRLLAIIYVLPVRFLAFMLDRKANWFRCWSLAIAAQLPGALWASAAILFYSLRQLQLIAFLCAFALHFVLVWLYLVFSPANLSPLPAAAAGKSNPFAAKPPPRDPVDRP